MDYQRIYNQLINRALSENRKKYKKSDNQYIYYENHHILPRCMGGTDEKFNLVLLLPEEHYLAHQLLIKIYNNNFKLLYSLVKMSGKSSNSHSRKFNNKLYGWIKKRISQAKMPEEHRNNISNALKGRSKTEEHIKNGVNSRKNNDNYSHTEASRLNISTSLSKLKWFNNGSEQIRTDQTPPPGFLPGRLQFDRKKRLPIEKIKIDFLDLSNLIKSSSNHGNSGIKNVSWKGYIHTPDGIFESSIDAAQYYGVTDSTIRSRCRSNNKDFKDWVLIKK